MQRRLDPAGWLWLAVAVVAVEIWVTYSRIPAHELYHVSTSGFWGGPSRMVGFLNFPVALIAVAIVLQVYERLSRRRRWVAIASIALCLVVVWPGVVSQANLDARPVNALAVVGVALAFALWLFAPRVPQSPLSRGDTVRIAFGVVAFLLALPWLAAELGFFLDGAPVLGWVFQTGKPYEGVATVHHGHHHGIDGLLLVACALVLSRSLPAMHGPRILLSAWLALMLPYGLANAANDIWFEQVVKRGWTSWSIPNMLVPKPSVPWLLIVIAAAVIWLAGYAITSTPRSASGFADRSS